MFTKQERKDVSSRAAANLPSSANGTQGLPAIQPQYHNASPIQNKAVVQRTIWDEVDVDFGAKPTMGPQDYADSLSGESDEFATLRGLADEQTQDLHGKNLSYKPRPKKGGGTSEAYFKDDSTFYNMDGSPAMVLSNIIFETANAAQGGRFQQVEQDYKNKTIMERTVESYGFDDLGEALIAEYNDGDAETRRAIIQERLEWNSFQLAKPSFLQVKAQMLQREKSKIQYETYFAAFDHMLEMDDFATYYNIYGKTHKGQVQGVLKKVAEQEKNKSKCYLTTACVTYRNLPDDCEELTVLRDFRDHYILQQPEGEAMVALYYRHAPAIVQSIRRRDDEEQQFLRIYRIIRYCVKLILSNRKPEAYEVYQRMVRRLYGELIAGS